MADHWDFHFAVINGKKASIFCNWSLYDRAPLEDCPQLLLFTIVMNDVREDGLCTAEESEALIEIEKTVCDPLEGEDKIVLAGRITSDSRRDFYFYCTDPGALVARLKEAAKGIDSHKFELKSRPDPDWEAYGYLLYPDPIEKQRVFNRHLMANLERHNDQITKPRQIDHCIFVRDAAKASLLADRLRQLDFEVQDPEPMENEPGAFQIEFHRVDAPADSDLIIVDLVKLAYEFEAIYDGWGCTIEKADDTPAE